MRFRSICIYLATCALIAPCAAPHNAGAAAAPLLPLEIGNHWEYLDASGTVAAQAITGTRTILGRTVVVKSYLTGPDAGLQNWWLTGPNGEVLLAGFEQPADGVSFAYETPITICGGSPSLGDSWTTHVVTHNLVDSLWSSRFDATFGVLEEVTLTLPGGTFPSFGVGRVLVPDRPAYGPGGIMMDGRRGPSLPTPHPSVASDWFSPGVGIVQFSTFELFRLTGYGNPTPARATTWGRLKQLYR